MFWYQINKTMPFIFKDWDLDIFQNGANLWCLGDNFARLYDGSPWICTRLFRGCCLSEFRWNSALGLGNHALCLFEHSRHRKNFFLSFFLFAAMNFVASDNKKTIWDVKQIECRNALIGFRLSATFWFVGSVFYFSHVPTTTK